MQNTESKPGRTIFMPERANYALRLLEDARTRGEISFLYACADHACDQSDVNTEIAVYGDAPEDKVAEICERVGIEYAIIPTADDLCAPLAEGCAPVVNDIVIRAIQQLCLRVQTGPEAANWQAVVVEGFWVAAYYDAVAEVVDLDCGLTIQPESAALGEALLAARLSAELQQPFDFHFIGARAVEVKVGDSAEKIHLEGYYPVHFDPVLPEVFASASRDVQAFWAQINNGLQTLLANLANWTPDQPLPAGCSLCDRSSGTSISVRGSGDPNDGALSISVSIGQLDMLFATGPTEGNYAANQKSTVQQVP